MYESAVALAKSKGGAAQGRPWKAGGVGVGPACHDPYMDLAHALEGLDTHPWADITHAYGSAEDLPALLRALVGDDADAADEAVSEVYGSVLHQGTVYAASAEVAPFLARVAAAGCRDGRRAAVAALDTVFVHAADTHWFRWSAIRAARATALLETRGRHRPPYSPSWPSPTPARSTARPWPGSCSHRPNAKQTRRPRATRSSPWAATH
jgi:hypothetical protein